jgi:predicted peptidase
MSRLIFLLIMMFALPSFAQIEKVPLWDKLLYTSGNETLPYRFLKPVNPQAKELFPLVIFLHGAGERGTDNEAQLSHINELFLDADNRSRHSCYVVAPQCPPGTMWASHDRDGNQLVMKEQPTRPMALVIALIDRIQKEFPIDPDRIYVTGLSMGGYGTWDLIARFPQRFAAAVPICGGGDPNTAGRIKHIPQWAFHGALDPVVAPRNSRIMVKALQDAGGTPGYTEYPDIQHDSWVYAYREPHLLPWLFDQYLGKKQKVK